MSWTLTWTVLYYVSRLAYYPILGVALLVPYAMGVSLLALLSVLLVRDDLVADFIARTSEQPAEESGQHRTAAVDAWSAEAAAVTSMPLPPALKVQMVVNRVRQYEAEHLAPVDKRLVALAKLLVQVDKETHQVQTEINFLRMYYTAWSNKFNETRSIATNTENRTIITGISSITYEQQEIPEILPDVVSDPSTYFMEIVTLLKSIIGSILRIVVRLLKLIMWVLKIIISRENMKRIIKINSFIQSQYMRNIIKIVVENANKIVNITTSVQLADGTTNFLFELFPDPNSQISNQILCH